jgi:hypothetical protein
MAEPQEHLQYLSAHCSTLSEGIRTSAARGVKSDVIADLQRNYQKECSEEDREARSRMSSDRSEAAVSKKSARLLAAQSQEQIKFQQQQCDESKRIIFVKKKRVDMTEGEKQDLQRFEQNYKERCS